MSASQAPASEQYANWLKFPNTYRKPTDEEWASHVDRLTAQISRLTENQRLQDSATAAVMERAEKAEAELAAFREDAERYRWLRTPKLSRHMVMFWMSESARYVALNWTDLDFAIDAARKEGA